MSRIGGPGRKWRACLRIARREVWRNKARSLVVTAMIGVPLLLVAAGTILTATLSPGEYESRLRELGAADALVTTEGRAPVRQDFTGRADPVDSAQDAEGSPWSEAEIADRTGGRVVAMREGTTLVTTGKGALAVDVRELDIQDPVFAGLARITAGRAPAGKSEVLVSEALRDRGFQPGGLVEAGDQKLDIVGVVRDPLDLRSLELVGSAGVLLAGADVRSTYLIDTNGKPITWDRVKQLNQAGLAVSSRAVLADPPPDDQLDPSLMQSSADNSWVMLVYGLAAACVLLEVVLLAGPAFAVGARRQRQHLALLVATGGEPRDVRRVVLAQGLVLGFGTAVAGIGLAFAGLLAARPLVERFAGFEIHAYDLALPQLAVVALTGTLAAFAAAFVPAMRAARQDPIEALSGRATVRTRAGWPVAGLLLAGGGIAILVYAVAGNGAEVSVVVGTIVLTVGLITLLPALLGLLGRVGTGLPLALRLAFRDTARHRARSTAAVAAVMGTIIGITALAIGSASDFAESRRDYVPRAKAGALVVTFGSSYDGSQTSEKQAAAVADRISESLTDRSTVVLRGPDDATTYFEVVTPDCANPCEQYMPAGADSSGGGFTILVADAGGAEAVAGRPLTAAQRDLLERGGALVADAGMLTAGGEVTVRNTPMDSDGSDEVIKLAGEPVPQLASRHGTTVSYLAQVVITDQTAKRMGLKVVPRQVYVPPGEQAIAAEQQDEIDEYVQGVAPMSEVYVERGFDRSYTPVFLILAGLGGLIVLVGTATSTALSLDDARPDFATLAAIGAAPRTRRAQAMAYAVVIGLTGAVLGVAAGAGPGIAISWPLTAPSPGGHILDIPWLLLGLVVVGVPLFTALCAALFTRSKLPMVRRAG